MQKTLSQLSESVLISELYFFETVFCKYGICFKACFFYDFCRFVKEKIKVIGVVGIAVYNDFAAKLMKQFKQVEGGVWRFAPAA
jgi:hypothetical protein